MKRNNKKGFTIVELVIVIAVIAILAAVLIPTFSGVVEKANASAALQEARNEYVEAEAMMLADDGVLTKYVAEVAGSFNSEAEGACEATHDHTKDCAGWEGYQAATGDKFVGKYFTFTVGDNGVITVSGNYKGYTATIADGVISVAK